MVKINKRVSELKVSAIRAVKQRSEELKSQGVRVYDLGIGEPEFATPEHIRSAAALAIEQGYTRYTVTAGDLALRKAIQKKFKNENGLDYTPEQIIVSPAGRHPLALALECVLEEGDEVILLAPYWITYAGLVHLARGKSVVITGRAENGYKVSAQEIEKHISPRTKAILFNSPANPTGAVYNRAEMRAIGKMLVGRDILVISDEMYEHYVYGDTEFCSFAAVNPELFNSVLTANAVSKTYAMTGWRLGYAAGPTELITAMGKYQGETVAHASSISQCAAIAALEGSLDFLKPQVANYERRIQLAASIIVKSKYLALPKVPQGSFFLFVNISKLIGRTVAGVLIDSADALQNVILNETGVIVISGAPFGDKEAFRLSVAAEDTEISAALELVVKLLG